MTRWSKSETLSLISLFKQHPLLYKASDPNYMKKSLKIRAFKAICAAMKKIRADVTPIEIRVKFNTIRGQLRRQKRLISDYKKNPSGEAHVPILWSYPYIQFLDEMDDIDEHKSKKKTEPSETIEFVNNEKLAFEDYTPEDEFPDSPEMPLHERHRQIDRVQKSTDELESKSNTGDMPEAILRVYMNRKENFIKYINEQLKLIQTDDAYVDTTLKILEVIQEGIAKDKLNKKYQHPNKN